MDHPKESLKIVRDYSQEVERISDVLENITKIKPTLARVIKEIQRFSGCEAVGIRLCDEQGDYPYFTWDGFKEDFVRKEGKLLARDATGNRILTPEGDTYLLECMCGNVICSKTDPSKPFFTQKGSFWSNNTSAMLEQTTDEDRGSHTRNYCNACGYESVALIPIANAVGRVGLIQLNDKRIGGFTMELIESLELLADHIGLALLNHEMMKNLKKIKTELARLRAEDLDEVIR
ncbi:MAG: GAF domain-containing protein [Candidatus Alcyoniella australis]|nr:GAF domain-containing protein [Candidatus Alcyoniella australis]